MLRPVYDTVHTVCVSAKSLQLCQILCDPMDCSPPGSSVWGFSRQEYRNGLPCPPPGDLQDPEIEPGSPALKADSLPMSYPGSPVHTIYVFTISTHPSY